jgi:sigma-E factor negative regulatory protein RseB
MTPGARVLVRHLAPPVLVLGLGAAGPIAATPVMAALEPQISPPQSAPVQASPVADLARMAAAVEDLSYEGTLVYLAENRLETLHIVHRIAAGGEVEERLVSLSGPVRAVTRQRDQVTCLLSDDNPISVKRNTAVPVLLRTRAIDPLTLAANYFVHPLCGTRVAGRDTDVVGVIPRDDYRYGYRFYLDRQTGLPLKSDLMGTKGEPIEQIMFTAVKVDPNASVAATRDAGEPGAQRLAASPVAASGPGDGKALPAAASPPGPSSSTPSSSAWRFDSLPPGFAVRMHDSWPDGPEGRVEHFLVTDHLASVSVFVEPEGQGGLTGETHIGAVHAVGGRVAGYQITVVGQVPAETVATVLAGVRHLGAGQP